MSAEDGGEWVYGVHAVMGLLKTAPTRIHEILLARRPGEQRLERIRALAESREIPWRWAERAELERCADGRHQGVAAHCAPGPRHDEEFLLRLAAERRDLLLLVLDGITDPHNLGACLRVADAAGVAAVVAPRDRAAGITAAVHKVASGAAAAVPYVVVTNLARALRRLRAAGVWVVGACGEAETSLYAVDLRGPLALVVGAEDAGLRRLTREGCDVLARLPMQGAVESLNAAVAAGICLFEAVRQRRPDGGETGDAARG
ncbi:MAG: 23S rRNA (guanosine(2251)-2'-O)-methyltransferase RlmB [Pseudomonadota bacterium]|jgi:23S rRNA (guanosine2251-2'-O)-methyltransferase